MAICPNCKRYTDNLASSCSFCGTSLMGTESLAAKVRRKVKLRRAYPDKATRPQIAGRGGGPEVCPTGDGELPASVVVYHCAEQFFNVEASGRRSAIARLFGSSLNLASLSSALLFAAYAYLQEKGYVLLEIAAATPAPIRIFPPFDRLRAPLQSEWIKILFSPTSLWHGPPRCLERMLHDRASRLTAEVTQRLIADLIGWPYLRHEVELESEKSEEFGQGHRPWKSHYAQALTSVIRQEYSAPLPEPKMAYHEVEALLEAFCARTPQVATSLNHEITFIINWISAKQDVLLAGAELGERPGRYEHTPGELPQMLFNEHFWARLGRLVS
ncbi:MAG: hypothetical protein ACE5NP_05205 [Anaerolineae bacterium]